MNSTISFALEQDVQHIKLEDYNEGEFAIARLGFLSTRPNSHGLEISEDVLKESASSALGKWLVAKMNAMGTDATSHEPTEHIMGIIPKDQDIEFVKDDDGYLRAYADVVVSKVYSKQFCDIFANGEDRAVSVEMTVSTENGKGLDDVVNSFNIIGVTVLGATVAPSCPESNIEFVRFAENAESYFGEAKKFAEEKENTNITEEDSVVDKEESRKEGESKMAEIEFAAVDIGDLWGSVWNALHEKYNGYDYIIKDIYEESNQKFALIKKYGEEALYRLDFSLTEEGLTLADEITKVSIEIVPSDNVQKFAQPENVEQYQTFATEEKKEDSEEKEEKEEKTELASEDEKKDEDKEEKAEPEEEKKAEMSADEMKEKIAELEAMLAERDTTISDQTVELAELRDYKNTCVEAEKTAKVTATMEKYASFMDEKAAKAFKEEGLKCDFAAIDGWANKVAASVADTVIKQKAGKKDNEDFTRMSSVKHIERDAEKAGTPLERLKNKYL